MYLVGPGENGAFRVNGAETLPASGVDGLGDWLDDVQDALPESGKVMVVYDADRSGSFLAPLAASDRIVVASAKATQTAELGVGGQVSFSKYFWQHVLNGSNAYAAVDYARCGIDAATQITSPVEVSLQEAQLDANGDGIYTSSTGSPDEAAAESYLVGAGIFLAGLEPEVNSVVGNRAIIKEGSTLDRVVMMGSDYYGDAPTVDLSKMGIGKNCFIRNAILDKNVRVGDNVVINYQGPETNLETELYHIIDGIVVVPKNVFIPANTTIV